MFDRVLEGFRGGQLQKDDSQILPTRLYQLMILHTSCLLATSSHLLFKYVANLPWLGSADSASTILDAIMNLRLGTTPVASHLPLTMW